ncbi:MAG: UDP-N-acetylmuramoyl-tripeptide--D-alanyl-D-alanine ligase [Deltaproteobacteria bacterium]|nr:UDP-N-acetylmuramoyl-tripeptide--D-alanyl-D-alanine ligase [Deltaproteobacteria bacterium]
MIKESLHWVLSSCAGRVLGQTLQKEFCGVSTDTRQIKAGELFFCLRAQRDGHLYLKEAIEKGCAAVVVDEQFIQEHSPQESSVPLIVVKDTLQALGDLAHAWRLKFNIPVLAITGSNGKTTTKELIKTVLEEHFKLLVTAGNLNNLIGVPKTLFQLTETHQIAIIEMGMNHYGEIARLTEIAKPSLALITNVGKAHLEHFGSVEAIAKAKGELFAGLSSDAIAFVNVKDPLVAALATPAKKIPFGSLESQYWTEAADSQDPDLLALQAHVHGQSNRLELRLLGEHNRQNILAALVIADHFGLSLEDAKSSLENFISVSGRMQLLKLKSGAYLINDCYNANPASMAAALKTLAHLRSKEDGQKALAILGEMLEVGEASENEHFQIGQLLADLGIEAMIAVGEHANSLLSGVQSISENFGDYLACSDNEAVKKILKDKFQDFSWILVKGSRGSHLEQVVDFLLSR